MHFMKCPLCDWSAEDEFERLKFQLREHMENEHPSLGPGRNPQQPPRRPTVERREIQPPAAARIAAPAEPVQLVKNPLTGNYEAQAAPSLSDKRAELGILLRGQGFSLAWCAWVCMNAKAANIDALLEAAQKGTLTPP